MTKFKNLSYVFGAVFLAGSLPLQASAYQKGAEEDFDDALCARIKPITDTVKQHSEDAKTFVERAASGTMSKRKGEAEWAKLIGAQQVLARMYWEGSKQRTRAESPACKAEEAIARIERKFPYLVTAKQSAPPSPAKKPVVPSAASPGISAPEEAEENVLYTAYVRPDRSIELLSKDQITAKRVMEKVVDRKKITEADAIAAWGTLAEAQQKWAKIDWEIIKKNCTTPLYLPPEIALVEQMIPYLAPSPVVEKPVVPSAPAAAAQEDVLPASRLNGNLLEDHAKKVMKTVITASRAEGFAAWETLTEPQQKWAQRNWGMIKESNKKQSSLSSKMWDLLIGIPIEKMIPCLASSPVVAVPSAPAQTEAGPAAAAAE